MKNICRTTMMAAAVVGAVACTSNYLSINQNPYGLTDAEMVRDGYGVGASLTGMASGVISPDVNTTQFTECLLGGTQGGYMADANSNFANTISNYNPTDDWTNVLMKSDKMMPLVYTSSRQLRIMTDDPVILAVSDIVKVAAMHRVTDAYGPIPYSQIGESGKLTVAYDSQEDVYRKMFEELDAAIEVLTPNVSSTFPETSDVIYGGNILKWVKFANSLKLRLAMRISYAAPALSKEMAESAVSHEIGVFTSNDDNAMFGAWGTDGNPIRVAVQYNKLSASECSTDAGDSHVAADIICYMNGYGDPRRSAYFTKSEWPGYDYVGLRRGISIPDHYDSETGLGGHMYSGFVINVTDPVCWMNAAEVAFLEAEAVAVFGYNMGGSTAKELYEKGIELSFGQWGVDGAASYMADDTSVPGAYTDPAGTNTYAGTLSSITIAWDDAATTAQKQERIIVQKWIANWLLGNEAWADWRRTGYPTLIPATEEGNKSVGMVDSKKGARRMPYPVNESSSNPANYQYAVSSLLGGQDNMSTRLWFDCNPDNSYYK